MWKIVLTWITRLTCLTLLVINTLCFIFLFYIWLSGICSPIPVFTTPAIMPTLGWGASILIIAESNPIYFWIKNKASYHCFFDFESLMTWNLWRVEGGGYQMFWRAGSNFNTIWYFIWSLISRFLFLCRKIPQEYF